MVARRVEVDRMAPDPAILRDAVEVVKRGGIVAYPTDTVYGLAALTTVEAVERIRRVKRREEGKPFLVALLDVPREGRWIAPLNANVARVVAVLWPQKVSLLLPAGPHAPPQLVAADGRVGLRRASDPITRALAAGVGGELVTTSANRSGAPSAEDADAVLTNLGEDVDLVLDGGRLPPGSEPTTLVDPMVRPPRIVRLGAVSAERIAEILGEEG